MQFKSQIQTKNNQHIEIVAEIPERGDKYPTIIMVPGFGVDLHEYGYFDDMSRVLVKNGFQTIRFSFAGTGNSLGNFSQMTIEDQAQQLKEIIKYTVSDRFTKKAKIGLLAHQFGVSTSLVSLPLPKIKSLVFTAALAHPDDVFGRWFRRQRGYNPDGISERELPVEGEVKIGSQFWSSLSHWNMVAQAKKITQPVLFVHGSFDRRVKTNEGYVLFAAVPKNKKFHLVEKADHSFSGKFREVVADLIIKRFNETL